MTKAAAVRKETQTAQKPQPIDEKAARAIIKARINLLRSQPFFGTLALRLRPTEHRGIPTAAVDGKRIFYNPDYILKQSPDIVESIIAHEVMHCALNHIKRLKGRQHMKWNIAGDFAINPLIQQAGFKLGEGWLFNPAYKDMTADQIYNLLPEMPKGKGGVGEAGGPQDEIMEGEQDAATQQAAEQEWRVAVSQAAAVAKQAGQMPSFMERYIDDLLNPQVPWREVLRRFIDTAARNDYTWSRPNRRFIDEELYLPSLYSESMGKIVVAVDTSGSIGDKTLAVFGTELRAIQADMRPESIEVIYCDAAINKVKSFGPDDFFKLEAVGGGGTDFRPPFKHIEKHNIVPVCFLYLTDMIGPFPDTAPDYPVMWVSTTKNEKGPFGDTLYIDE